MESNDTSNYIATSNCNTEITVAEMCPNTTLGAIASGYSDSLITRKIIKQEENKMADVDTAMLQQDHSDIRREAAEHRATITQEAMKGFDRVNADVLRSGWQNTDATKDARYDIATRISSASSDLSQQVDAIDDTLSASLFTIGRDSQDIRAQIISAQQAMITGFLGVTKDTELNALKTQIETARQTTYLSDKIDADGEKTRGLINDLKYHDLNRALVERNSELVEEREGRRYWRHAADQNQFQGQWAALQNQIQAFQSQLQETRQGMVNFGTMAGVGQSSTTNAVR